jgi:glycosyltransferase involved in cell wall biosynthesis
VPSASPANAPVIGIDGSRIHAPRLTGTERYAREVIAAMLRLAPDQHVRLYLRNPLHTDGSDAAFYTPNCTPVVIGQTRLWTHRGLAAELRHTPPGTLFVPAHVLPFSARGAAFKRHTRSVVTIHDCGFAHFPQAHPLRQRLYLHWSTRFATRHASVLLADSEATRRDLETLYGARDVRVVYPGLPEQLTVGTATQQAVLARFELQPGAYLLHVGTLQPRKNLRRLIAAFAQVRTHPATAGLTLMLAGGAGWGGEDLRGEIARLGLTNSVRLTGYINDADKAALLSAACAYAMPSLYEGFGFPVLEANAAGIPVACSETSSLGEVAGDAAHLFNPLDVDAITRALIAVCTDDALRARLIDAGRRNVTRFSWERCARAVLDALTRPKNLS